MYFFSITYLISIDDNITVKSTRVANQPRIDKTDFTISSFTLPYLQKFVGLLLINN